MQKGICLFLSKVTNDYREKREEVIWNIQSDKIIDHSTGRCGIKTFPGNLYCQVKRDGGLGILNTKTGHLEISSEYSEIRQVHKRFFIICTDRMGSVMDSATGKIIARGTSGWIRSIKYAMGPYLEIDGEVFNAKTAEKVEGVSYHLHGYYFQLEHQDDDTSGIVNLLNGKKQIVALRRVNFKHMGSSYFSVIQYLGGSRKKYSVLNFRTGKITKIA